MNHQLHSHRLRKVWWQGIRFMPPTLCTLYSDSTNVCVSRVAPPNRKEGWEQEALDYLSIPRIKACSRLSPQKQAFQIVWEIASMYHKAIV